MNINQIVYFSLVIISMIIVSISSNNRFNDKVKLVEVQNLKFYRGLITKSRRVSPVQQLSCIGGSFGCSRGSPDEVECFNRGIDSYGKVQWECVAKLPDDAKFGVMTVGCEGYENKDDPFVLVGSCGLEYKLDNKHETEGSYFVFFIVILAIIGIFIFITSRSSSGTGTNQSSETSNTSSSTHYRNNRRSVSRSRSRGRNSSRSYSSGLASTSNR